MQWIDICAAVAAGRHARTPVVTASVDKIDFHNPVPVGGIVVLLASVNFAGRTSMEVGVKVWQEDRATGNRRHVVSAYLTFVSLDPETKAPSPVPPVLPETADEKRRFAAAQERRAQRLRQRA
jgi:acyl-CoA hydrolase